ncbi:hypothetical protein ACJJTC_005106 [Scirpophaga incertulas]
MQLILDCETAVEANKTMATIDDSSVMPHGDIEHLNLNVNHGNKENIQCKENIIKRSESTVISSEKDDLNMEIDEPLLSSHVNNNEDNVTKELDYVNSNPMDTSSNDDNDKSPKQSDAKEQKVENKVDSEETNHNGTGNDLLVESTSCNKYVGIVGDKDESNDMLREDDNLNGVENSNANAFNLALPSDTKKIEYASNNTCIDLKNEKQHSNDEDKKNITANENFVKIKKSNLNKDIITYKENNEDNKCMELTNGLYDLDKEEDHDHLHVNVSSIQTNIPYKDHNELSKSENDISVGSDCFNASTLEVKVDNIESAIIEDINENKSLTIHKSNMLQEEQESVIPESEGPQSVSKNKTVQESITVDKAFTHLPNSNVPNVIEESTIQKSKAPETMNEETIMQQSADHDNDFSPRQESCLLKPIVQALALQKSEAPQLLNEKVSFNELTDNENESSSIQKRNILESQLQESAVMESSTHNTSQNQSVTIEKSENQQLIVEEVTIHESFVEELPVEESIIQNSIEEKLTIQESTVDEYKNLKLTVQESTVDESKLMESPVDESKLLESPMDESKIQNTTVQNSTEQELTVQECKREETKILLSTGQELTEQDIILQESTLDNSKSKESIAEKITIQEPTVDESKFRNSPLRESTEPELTVQASSKPELSVQKSTAKDVAEQTFTAQESTAQVSLSDLADNTTTKEYSGQESSAQISTCDNSIEQEKKKILQDVALQEATVEEFMAKEICVMQPTTKSISSEQESAFKDIQKSAVQEATLQSIVIEPLSQQSSDVIIVNTSEQEVTAMESKVQSVIDNGDVTKIIDNNLTKRKREEEAIDVPKKLCKLSNTLDIFSDDEDNDKKADPKDKVSITTAKQYINIEDDDDIMLIDEEVSSNDNINKIKENSIPALEENICNTVTDENEKVSHSPLIDDSTTNESVVESDVIKEESKQLPIEKKPLLAENFMKSQKKNLADMSRDELEEFCVLKIVESVIDRSSLSEIKSKLKVMTQSIDEYKRKALLLTRQNRDLQVVLKSVQEEQKKPGRPVIPLKITRSVGVQVTLTLDLPPPPSKGSTKRKAQMSQTGSNNNKIPRAPTSQSPKALTSKIEKPSSNQIPVPRLIPANNPAAKTTNVAIQNGAPSVSNKLIGAPLNLPKQSPPKPPEKRPLNKAQSVTVDLTDDESPPKQTPRNSAAQPVRLVSPQTLLAPQRQSFNQSMNSPRKVYIPIGGPQNQGIRPGQTIMLKTVPAAARPRFPPQQLTRMPQSPVRMQRIQSRHPAPLPDAMKQYQPPNWKSLPPAPDLKLSKVENGIVISWKIDGYQEDAYEEIASYQLYAYQENSLPPSTTLWKKIGDVKALPLPMACTLTQFMAGFKYYFAVRAVDIRSRLGPFSLPGSILLLNKM